MNEAEREEYEAFFDASWEQEEFARRGNSVSDWLGKAAKLMSVVRIVEPSCKKALAEFDELNRTVGGEAALRLFDMSRLDPVSVLAMLRAMAVECTLKALYLKVRGPLVRDGKYVGPTKHDLHKLAAEVGFEASPDEAKLLLKLSLWLTSHGRYPIGLKWDYDRSIRRLTGQIGPISSWGRTDGDDCDVLVQDLRAMIAKHSTDG